MAVSDVENEAITIMVAIIVLAGVAVAVSKAANTPGLISGFTGFYTAVIQKIVAPLSSSAVAAPKVAQSTPAVSPSSGGSGGSGGGGGINLGEIGAIAAIL